MNLGNHDDDDTSALAQVTCKKNGDSFITNKAGVGVSGKVTEFVRKTT